MNDLIVLSSPEASNPSLPCFYTLRFSRSCGIENVRFMLMEEKAGGPNPALIAVHAVLAILMLVLGTAGPVVFID